MDPRSNNNSGLGLPQPGNDMGQLPPIHTPQSFHAPENAAPHFDAVAPQVGQVPPAAMQPMPAAPPIPQPSAAVPMQPPVASQQPTTTLPPATPPAPSVPTATSQTAGPADDNDTAFDNEWIGKARELVERTRNDPYMQSLEMSKLKSQYIKLRYGKDVKVSE